MKFNAMMFTTVISIMIIFGLYLLLDKPIQDIEDLNAVKGQGMLERAQGIKVQLNGEWEYIDNVLVQPESFEKPTSNYKDVPSLWRYAGVGTYKLTLYAKKEIYNLGMTSPTIYSAYNLYLNGELIAFNGYPSVDAKYEKIQRSSYVLPITLNKGKNELVIQVSNHHLFKGGISEAMVLMDYDELEAFYNRQRVIDIFFVGVFSFISILFIIVFLIRVEMYIYLYFSIIAFGFCLKTMVSNSILITELFPDLSWEISNRIESGFNFVILPLLLLLILVTFEEIFDERIHAFLKRLIVLNVFTVTFIPHIIYDSFMYIMFAGILVLALYITYMIVKNIRYYYFEVVLLCIGYVTVLSYGVLDLINYVLMRQYVYKIHYSGLVLSLNIIVLLLSRFENAVRVKYYHELIGHMGD